jgi:hypothetical protein
MPTFMRRAGEPYPVPTPLPFRAGSEVVQRGASFCLLAEAVPVRGTVD